MGECGGVQERIRAQFREKRECVGVEEINQLLADGESRLRVLRMRTPKSAFQRQQKPRARFAVDTQDMKVVEVTDDQVESRASAFFKDQSLDPADIKRHQQLLRRQHFMEQPPF